MTGLIAVFAMLIMLGLVMVARGAVAKRPSLRDHLDYFLSSASDDGADHQPVAADRLNGVLVSLHGSRQDRFLADLEVVGRTERDHAAEVVKGALGAALLLFILFAIFLQVSVLTVVGALLLGQPVGYLMVEAELTKKAKARRAEFEETLTSVVSLMAVAMAGGSGLNTAIKHTLALGEGWVVEALARAVDEADFRKETPWVVFEGLGRDLRVPALVELSSSLNLVGASGARVAETLTSRAESARAKALVAHKAAAEAKSSAMGVPLGVLTVAWVLFLTYPAVSKLVAL
jgi:Flp pilus assembly protein TadB